MTAYMYIILLEILVEARIGLQENATPFFTIYIDHHTTPHVSPRAQTLLHGVVALGINTTK